MTLAARQHAARWCTVTCKLSAYLKLGPAPAVAAAAAAAVPVGEVAAAALELPQAIQMEADGACWNDACCWHCV